MFGFIKNLVKKSDNNFFLELKEEVETKIDEAKNQLKEVKETIDTKVTEAKQPNSNGAKPASAKPVPAAEAAPVKPAAKPAATPDTNGKSRKDAAAAKAAKIEAQKAAKEAEAASSSDPAQLIAKATAKKQSVEPVEKNFATKYLMTPSGNGRRRPGANMNSYLEMARQVKTPEK